MNPDRPKARHVVGVMTGTSIDGIDASLVHITGSGLNIHATLLRHLAAPLENIGTRLRDAAAQQPMTAGDFAKLAWDFGQLHAAVIEKLLNSASPADSSKPGELDLICVHGQTIFHQPPISWQLINPAPIAQRFRCPIISDFRQADLAAGGQGAPITPIADWILFSDQHHRRAIINLGGFCNATILPTKASFQTSPSEPQLQAIRGFDVCACNQLLDEIARRALKQPYDEGGRAARNGKVIAFAAQSLQRILRQQRAGKRSLGTGDEASQWSIEQINAGLTASDIAATAVHCIASCINDALCDHQVHEIIVAGGGARNVTLVDALAAITGLPVRPSDDLGVPIEARESMAFAVLGALCADGVPITLPQVTGCSSPPPLSGMWSFAHRSSGMQSRGC